MSIASNLGRIATCGQFFVYRLSEWDGSKWRRKEPWANGRNVSPSDPANWRDYEAARADVATRVPTADIAWAVGLWITADLNLFFLDIDKLPADYTLDDTATALLQKFPGCMVEWSSSRRGVHVLGTYNGNVEHSKKPTGTRLELYTDERGIALADTASGSADTNAHDALLTVIDRHFKPRTTATNTLVLPATPGAPDLSALALVLRLCDKIIAAPDGERNHTLNTAAYTVGGMVAAGRIDRAEARAALVNAVERAGWGNMPLQLSKIDQGLNSGTDEPLVRTVPVAAAVTGEADWHTLVDTTIATINNTGTYKELVDVVVPSLSTIGFPFIHAERIVSTLKERFTVFNASVPVGRIRQMVTPTVTATTSTPPDWFAPFVYLKQRDKFYNRLTGGEYTMDAFRMEFGRYMPPKQNGQKDDPVGYARDHWNVVTVEDAMYDPRQSDLFEFAGGWYVNAFRWSSLPPLTTPTENCVACIQAFQRHLYDITGRRDELYLQLLMWLAHNVQKPGHKIRWAPLVKGVGGDGKSIVGDLMFAVLGYSNVKITSISNINNSGGFTDWAVGKAVNFIEEIRLEGRDKRKLYNAMKNIIGDHHSDTNRKGKAAGDTTPNVTNHWANTNYGDAIPPDEDDRRWCVLFTPWGDAYEAARYKGLGSVDELVRHFKWMGDSMRAEPGAWRSWLAGLDLTSFEPDGRAPETDEKQSMKLMASDPLDQIVMDVLERGGIGITKDVFSSSCLMVQVRQIWGENPGNRGWNTLLTRLGYQQLPKTVWFLGTAHRIWSKSPITPDEVRNRLPSC